MNPIEHLLDVVYFGNYVVAMSVGNMMFFSAAVCRGWWMVEVFQIVKSLLHFDWRVVELEHATTICQQFTFSDKIDCICADLDSTLVSQNLAVQSSVSWALLWDSFQTVQPKGVDRILGKVRSLAHLSLVHCGLLKTARPGLLT